MPEIFSQQKIAAAQDAAQQQQIMQMAQMAVQQRHYQEAQDDKEMSFALKVANDPGFSMDVKLPMMQKVFGKMMPGYAIQPEHFDEVARGLKLYEETAKKGGDTSQFSTLFGSFVDRKMVAPEYMPQVGAIIQQGQQDQANKVLDLEFPKVTGVDQAKARLERVQPMLDYVSQNPDKPYPAQLEEVEDAYGGPQEFKKRMSADQLIIENDTKQNARRDRQARLFQLDQSLVHAKIKEMADPVESLRPLIAEAMTTRQNDLTDQDYANIHTYYAMTKQPEMSKLWGDHSAAAESKKWAMDLQAVQGRVQSVTDIANQLQSSKTQAAEMESRLIQSSKQYMGKKTMDPEELKGLGVQLAANATEATQAAKDWQQQTSGTVDRLTKDASAALDQITTLTKSLSSPGADRDTINKRIKEQQEIHDSNVRMADLLGQYSPMNISMARLAVEHYDLDLKSMSKKDEGYEMVKSLRDAKAEEVNTLETKQDEAKTIMDSEQKRLLERQKVTQVRASFAGKKAEQADRNIAAARAYFGDLSQVNFDESKLPPDQWLTKNAVFGADAKGFDEQIKPLLANRYQFKVQIAQERAMREGKDAVPRISRELGVKPTDILGALDQPKGMGDRELTTDQKMNMILKVKATAAGDAGAADIIDPVTGMVDYGRLVQRSARDQEAYMKSLDTMSKLPDFAPIRDSIVMLKREAETVLKARTQDRAVLSTELAALPPLDSPDVKKALESGRPFIYEQGTHKFKIEGKGDKRKWVVAE